MRILFAAELEGGRGAKLPDPSNLLALTADAMPLLPVTGGTNGQITGGFIMVVEFCNRQRDDTTK